MFSITSYNILSHLAYVDWQKSLYTNKLEERYENIQKELLDSNSDIYCLQEVTTTFRGYLDSFIDDNGYKMVYVRRGDDCSQPIMYKEERFELMDEWYWVIEEVTAEFAARTKCVKEECVSAVLTYIHRPADYAVQAARLRDKHSKDNILVFNIHNIWEDHEKDDAKAFHMAAILWKANSIIDGSGKVCVFFCGDFNSYPDTPLYSLMELGRASKASLRESVSSPVKVMKTAESGSGESRTEELYLYQTLAEEFDVTHNMKLKSAHRLLKKCEPAITSWDSIKRNTGCYDYIFFSADTVQCLDVHIEVVDYTAAMGMEQAFLNSKWSDHLPLTATFQLK